MVEEDVLTKKGADLFKELLRVYSVADLEDYFKAGIWKDEIMKADLQLIVAHRREAGAPDPPDLEDVVMPEIPKTLLGGGILGVRPVVPMGLLAGLTRPAGPTALLATSPARPGGLLAGTMPGVVRPGIAGPLAASLAGTRPAVVAAGVAPGAAAVQAAGVAPTTGPAAELKLIALFIAKWKLDPTRTKMMLAKMTPAKRRFVITHFKNTTSAADPTGALEQYISQCEKTNAWGAAVAAAATPGVVAPRPTAPKPVAVPAAMTAPATTLGVKRPVAPIAPVLDPSKRPRIGPVATIAPTAAATAAAKAAIAQVRPVAMGVRPAMAQMRPAAPQVRPPTQAVTPPKAAIRPTAPAAKEAARPPATPPPKAAIRPATPAAKAGEKPGNLIRSLLQKL